MLEHGNIKHAGEHVLYVEAAQHFHVRGPMFLQTDIYVEESSELTGKRQRVDGIT